jgi:hypothetical protein
MSVAAMRGVRVVRRLDESDPRGDDVAREPDEKRERASRGTRVEGEKYQTWLRQASDAMC